MYDDISFPNLGITLEHVGKSISIFGFEIAYYGIIIGIALLAGFWIATAEAKRTGQNPDHFMDMGFIGVVCGIVGARLYYVIFRWDSYKDHLLSIFNLREGGLAIYGGIAGAVLTMVVYVKVKHLRFGEMADVVALALVNGQMLGRWGNFFNREVFGEYTDSLLAMRLPLYAVRTEDVSALMEEHIQEINGIRYIQVHPTFLYESLWCLGLLLLLWFYRKRKKFSGEIFCLYLLGYGVGRFWIEGIRTDQLLLPGTELPVSQVLSAVLVLVSAGVLLWKRRRKRELRVKGENKS